MVKVFLNDAGGYLGGYVRAALEASSDATEVLTATEELLAADVVVLTCDGDLDEVQEHLALLADREDDAGNGADEGKEGDGGGDGASFVLRKLIFVSSALTWARSSDKLRRPEPVSEIDEDEAEERAEELAAMGASSDLSGPGGLVVDTEEPAGFYFEADYKQRRAAARYALHRTLETMVLGMGRPGFETTVLAAGLTYGGSGGDFAVLLRNAWQQAAAQEAAGEDVDLALAVPSSGDGANVLPTVHAADIGSTVAYLSTLEGPTPRVLNEGSGNDFSRYAVLVDGADAKASTLAAITAAAAAALGDGATRQLPESEARALLLEEPSLGQLQHDMSFSFKGGLLPLLQQGPPVGDESVMTVAAEKLLPPLAYAGGLVQHMAKIAAEFVAANGLKPAIEAGFPDTISATELSPELRAGLLRQALLAPQCRNAGYVLDGAPLSRAEARALYSDPAAAAAAAAEGGEGKEDEETEGGLALDSALAPTQALLLICADGDYLTEAVARRVAAESLAAAEAKAAAAAVAAAAEGLEPPDPNTEQMEAAAKEASAAVAADTAKRLDQYREQNEGKEAEEDAAVVFFEKDCPALPILSLPIGPDAPAAATATEEALAEAAAAHVVETSTGGVAPFNFHPTRREAAAARLEAAKAEKARAAAQAEALAAAEAADAAAVQAAEDKKTSRFKAVQAHETDLLNARSQPLRRYLMANVMPSLTQGLLDVVQQQPDDPVDHLAEFLFRKNLEAESEASDFKSEFTVTSEAKDADVAEAKE